MGKQSSKIKDILFVTGSDLDPPELRVQKKYVPTKQPYVDLKGFGPKKYYKKDATNEEVEQHLSKLQKKEGLLKLFKYYQDFDRISFREMQLNVAAFESYVEENFKIAVFAAIIGARVLQLQLFNEYYTNAGWMRFIFPCFCVIVPVLAQRALLAPEYHIANHEYFRLVQDQTSLYQQFDLQLNLYKDVEDMKYNFKYPKVRDFYRIKREVFDRDQAGLKGLYREYFQYNHQLKFDKYEEFIKLRYNQRKQEKELITDAELNQIEADLQKKQKLV